jgi:hypothetical protein
MRTGLTVCEHPPDQYGYEPVREILTQLRLRTCPFHPLAAKAPDLVWGMNHAFLSGYLDGLKVNGLQAVLAPEAGECCVRLGPRGSRRRRPGSPGSLTPPRPALHPAGPRPASSGAQGRRSAAPPGGALTHDPAAPRRTRVESHGKQGEADQGEREQASVSPPATRSSSPAASSNASPSLAQAPRPQLFLLDEHFPPSTPPCVPNCARRLPPPCAGRGPPRSWSPTTWTRHSPSPTPSP